MDQLANSNISSEKEENGRKNSDNEEEVSEEDEFDLAYKMIFTDTLRTRDDQVPGAVSLVEILFWFLHRRCLNVGFR